MDKLNKINIDVFKQGLKETNDAPRMPKFVATKVEVIDDPEIGRRGILGSVLSVVGAFALPALLPAFPGLGFLGAAITKGGLLGGLIRAGLGATGSFIGGTIGNLISPAEVPSYGNISSPFRDQPFTNSPTFSLRGIQNTKTPDGPIPIIYGKRRIGGLLISQRLETIGDDVYFWGLFALCEGEVESVCGAGLSDLRMNGQSGSNFDSVELWTRAGTKLQTVIPGFEELIVSYVRSAKLTATPSTYTTVTDAMIGFIVRIEAPAGIYHIAKQGGVNNNTAKYKIEYRVNTPPGSWVDLGITTISAAKIGVVREVFEKRSLTADKYDIRVTRTSAEQTGSRDRSDIYWVGIEEITGDEFIYPHTALAGVKVKATNQLSGAIPTFTFLVEGLKVLDTTSLGDAKAYSRNPADCYYDLLIASRYGLGRFIASADVNTDKLAIEAAHYDTTATDGAGGTETRNVMDAVIDTHADAQQTLIQLMSNFRASPLWSEGLTSLVTDRVKSPVHIFGMGNIVKDSYSSSFPDIKNAPNKIIVQFPNEDKDYKMDTISVVDEDAISNGLPIRSEQMLAAAVTKKSEAYRLGNYRLNIGKYITRAVEFEAFPESVDLQAGDLFTFQHDVPQWGWGGRIESYIASPATIVVDQDLVLAPATSYVFQVVLPDGTIEQRAVTNSAETTRVLTLASAFSAVPNTLAIYFFGETTNEKIFTCLTIAMTQDKNRRIAGVEYNSNVYSEVALLPTDNASALPTPEGIPPDIENLTLLENQATPKSMIVSFNMPNPSGAWDHALVELSSDGGNTYFPYTTVTASVDVIIVGLIVGKQYYVRMTSLSRNNIESASPPTANITITGNPFTPSNVRGLEIKDQGNTVTFTGREVTFVWKKNSPITGVGVDGAGDETLGAGSGAEEDIFKDYKIDIYVSSVIVRTAFVVQNSFHYTEQMNIADNSGVAVRAFQVRVSARNKYNDIGGEAVLDVSNPAPDMSAFTPVAVNLFGDVQISFEGFVQTDPDFSYYEMYMDTNNPPTTLIATLDANTKQFVKAGLDSSTVYYIKIIPYDVFGAGIASAIDDITTSPSILRDRNLALDGIEISAENPTSDTMYWTAGNISYLDNDGNDQTVTISASNNLWTTGKVFLYWVIGATSLSTTTNQTLAFDGDNVIIATYKGGDDLTIVFGRVIVDGSDILAGSVTASQITTATAVITVAAQIANAIITAAHIQAATITDAEIANATITDAQIANTTITAAKIALATITDAQIASLNADKITAGSVTGRTVQTASSGDRVVMNTTELAAYKGSDKRFEYNISSGDLKVGDYNGAAGLEWDESNNVMTVRGVLRRQDVYQDLLLPLEKANLFLNSRGNIAGKTEQIFAIPFMLTKPTTTITALLTLINPDATDALTGKLYVDNSLKQTYSFTGAETKNVEEDINISTLNRGMHVLSYTITSGSTISIGTCCSKVGIYDKTNAIDGMQNIPFFQLFLAFNSGSGISLDTGTSYVEQWKEKVNVASGLGTVNVFVIVDNVGTSHPTDTISARIKIGSATSSTITTNNTIVQVNSWTSSGGNQWGSGGLFVGTINLSSVSGVQSLTVETKESNAAGVEFRLIGYIVSE